MRATAVLVLGLALGAGCKDQAKESAKLAAGNVDELADLVDKDVAEIERGLPEGAKRLAKLYDEGDTDPTKDLPAVRMALLQAQRQVPDLNVAKSTFFALTDQKGVGIRNNLEQDAMAGQDLAKLFPGISKAMGGEYVETTGSFGGPPTPQGPDRDWVAASPVKSDGKVVAIFVTGWSFRRFASHLQQVLKEKFQSDLRKSGDTGKMPIFYVAVFDSSGVYSERTTPKVDEQALADTKLVDKTKSGPAQGTVTITDRAFGWAAKRTPKLGPDAGIVVLRSEL